MMGLRVVLSPFDTLHFSSGRPFHQGDEGLAVSASVFPPAPYQVASAVRASIGYALGLSEPALDFWDPDQRLTLAGLEQLTIGQVLGDGPWDFGALSVSSPRVFDGKSDWVPAPRTLFAEKGGSLNAANKVRAEFSVASDLGDGSDQSGRALLHVDKTILMQPETSCFVRRNRLLEVVEDPDFRPRRSAIQSANKLWSHDEHVGLGLDHATKTAKDSQLYIASQVRLADANQEISPLKQPGVAVEIAFNLPDRMHVEALERHLAKSPVPAFFGGRGRVAHMRCEPIETTPSEMPSASGSLRVCLLSPGLIASTDARLLQPGEAFLGLPGLTLSAASMERLSRYAAWSSRDAGRGNWLWQIPAGSVFDLLASDPEGASSLEILDRNGINAFEDHEGARRARNCGFGDFMISGME